MELTKTKITDKIEIINPFSTLQVRETIIIKEGEQIISRSSHRYCIAPGDDYSQCEDMVKAICDLLHTKEVIAAFKESEETS